MNRQEIIDAAHKLFHENGGEYRNLGTQPEVDVMRHLIPPGSFNSFVQELAAAVLIDACKEMNKLTFDGVDMQGSSAYVWRRCVQEVHRMAQDLKD